MKIAITGSSKSAFSTDAEINSPKPSLVTEYQTTLFTSIPQSPMNSAHAFALQSLITAQSSSVTISPISAPPPRISHSSLSIHNGSGSIVSSKISKSPAFSASELTAIYNSVPGSRQLSVMGSIREPASQVNPVGETRVAGPVQPASKVTTKEFIGPVAVIDGKEISTPVTPASKVYVNQTDDSASAAAQLGSSKSSVAHKLVPIVVEPATSSSASHGSSLAGGTVIFISISISEPALSLDPIPSK